MTALETAALYYDAWQNKHGDFSEVPLAEGFEFVGPVASFDTAEGYRAMAAEAGQAVTSFAVRRQFVDGNTVCSIIDWEMAMPWYRARVKPERESGQRDTLTHLPPPAGSGNLDDRRNQSAPAAVDSRHAPRGRDSEFEGFLKRAPARWWRAGT